MSTYKHLAARILGIPGDPHPGGQAHTGTSEEQRKVLAGWIPKLLVERQGKSIIVSMEIYVPPIPGPDPPIRRRYVVQRPGTPWGHTSHDLMVMFLFKGRRHYQGMISKSPWRDQCPITRGIGWKDRLFWFCAGSLVENNQEQFLRTYKNGESYRGKRECDDGKDIYCRF